MASTSSYNNERVVMGEVEYPAADPASGAFFKADYKKNDDLKIMLDGSKDSLKLEAMKRIIGMIAKGRDASDLFPAVVKNVVSKNIEVKKLVYVYLVRYAEEQQDLALLSISTFQRALKDPNQLIRASALRVMSSIRVNMIVPIVLLSIKESSSDMSPYVRKTAAHAIPKLYSLDPEQKEDLVTIIDKLLSDKAPLVVGSAAMAFTEVCPERIASIHWCFRKLCTLLMDVDEWGQLVLLDMLTIYAKTFFCDPNADSMNSDSDKEKPFYDDSDSDSSAADGEKNKRTRRKSVESPTLDPDHKTLLRAAKPLLQSRNTGVVMAVAQLFYHCGPAQDLPPVAKAMVRLLRAPLEVQSVVLHSIASLTISKRTLFEPFLKSFFVRTSDPTHIKLLKLEILTNLATESSATVVLREFQTYVTSNDKTFAGATIQAIGRLASNIETVTENCLNGLLHLLSSKDEWVVCEAVVVVKRVVAGGASSARAAVSRALKLLRDDRLAGNARAAALWLVAEHGADSPRSASVLAHLVMNFANQEELVKLQLLTLAVKLSITQPSTLPLSRYALTLARYDTSYDVRDRARLLRRFVDPEPGGRSTEILKKAADIFLAVKPAPVMESRFKDREQFKLGTLAHYVGIKTNGYMPLPDSPSSNIGAQERDAADVSANAKETTQKTPTKDKSFYSEPNSSGSGSSSASSTSESSGSESEEGEDKKESDSKAKQKENNNHRQSDSGTSDSESDSESSSSEESSDESSNESSPSTPPDDKKESELKPSEKSNLELLLELDEAADSLPTMTPVTAEYMPQKPMTIHPASEVTPSAPGYIDRTGVEMISRVMSGGLQATRFWSRLPHLASQHMIAIDIKFTNFSKEDINDLKVDRTSVRGGRAIHDFAPINVRAGESATVTIGIDFGDSLQPANFAIISSAGEVPVCIKPPIGELVRAVTMTTDKFDTETKALRGMNECEKKTTITTPLEDIQQRVFETANVHALTPTGNYLRFAGRLMSSGDLVFIIVKPENGQVVTHCANMAIAALMANEIALALSK